MIDDGSDDPFAFRVVSSFDGGSWVVTAVGELDISSAGKLREALDAGFDEGRESVVLDLGGITFIDSSGLSVLLNAYKRTAALEGSLRLQDPSPSVVRLLELSGQTDRFLGPGG